MCEDYTNRVCSARFPRGPKFTKKDVKILEEKSKQILLDEAHKERLARWFPNNYKSTKNYVAQIEERK